MREVEAWTRVTVQGVHRTCVQANPLSCVPENLNSTLKAPGLALAYQSVPRERGPPVSGTLASGLGPDKAWFLQWGKTHAPLRHNTLALGTLPAGSPGGPGPGPRTRRERGRGIWKQCQSTCCAGEERSHLVPGS